MNHCLTKVSTYDDMTNKASSYFTIPENKLTNFSSVLIDQGSLLPFHVRSFL